MNKPTQRTPSDGAVPRPARESDGEMANEFDRSQDHTGIDDPGDAQRASKLDEEGDGEEELR